MAERKLSSIFLIMLKLGAVTFGGGYVMVTLFEDEFVRKRGWIEPEDMVNMAALSQSVPGVIAVNSGILIGYRLRGVKGALIAAAGVVLPSLVILTAVTYLYEEFRANAYIAGALRGVRAAVSALLVSAFWRFSKPFRKDYKALAVFAAAFLTSLLAGVNSIFIIIGGAVSGMLLGLFIIKKPSGNAGGSQ